MVLGLKSVSMIFSKSGGACACCGDKNVYLDITGFFPAWTRVENSTDNYIPICKHCLAVKGIDYLELFRVPFLNKEALYSLMLFYRDNMKYLKYYTKRFGEYRTGGLIDVNRAMTVLGTYDVFLDEHEEELRDYVWRINNES